MSVSLTQVQSALHGPKAGGASGPLTLNVLQKTDAIIAQLKALQGAKPVSVEVLSAQLNGRASVSVGGLTLAVKSSLPLKAGEVFALKIQQTGYSIKLVQPLNAEGQKGQPQGGVQNGALKGAGQTPQTQGLQTQALQTQALQTGAKLTATEQPLAQQNSALNSSPLKTGTHSPPSQTIKTDASALPQAATPAAKPAAPPALNGAPPKTADLNVASHKGAAPPSTVAIPLSKINSPAPSLLPPKAGTSLLGASNPLSASGLQNGVPTANIIRAVADALPALAGRADEKQATKPLKGERISGLQGGRGAITALGEGAQGGPTRAETQSPYAKLSGGVIEEIAELNSRAAQKGADITLELPLHEGGKPISVGLYIFPDPEGGSEEKEAHKFAVSFSLETAETGPVHAELTLLGRRLALQLWAEEEEFYQLLDAEFMALQQRIEAVGLEPGSLRLRRGRPRRLMPQSHWDQQI